MAPAQGRWAPGRAAKGSFFLPEPVRRRAVRARGTQGWQRSERGAGTPATAPGWAPRTLQVCLLLLHSILMLSESCAASPGAGFVAFEPPTNTPEAQKCAWVLAPSFTHGNAGAIREVRSLRGLRATPVSSCLSCPGRDVAAERAPGFGSRSLGGPAEPAGLPGEPCPGLELEPQPQQRELSKTPVPGQHPPTATAPLPWAGSSQGLPAWKMSAPSGLTGPFLGPRRRLSPAPAPQFPSQRSIFGSRAAAQSAPARIDAMGRNGRG